jgi:hypothetical protein
VRRNLFDPFSTSHLFRDPSSTRVLRIGYDRQWSGSHKFLREAKMDMEIVRKRLGDIALSHAKDDDDSKEMLALRDISHALLHMAQGLEEMQRTSASPIVGR